MGADQRQPHIHRVGVVLGARGLNNVDAGFLAQQAGSLQIASNDRIDLSGGHRVYQRQPSLSVSVPYPLPRFIASNACHKYV